MDNQRFPLGKVRATLNTTLWQVAVCATVSAVILGASAPSIATVQEDGLAQGAKTLKLAAKSAKALRIAQERFRFVKWYASKWGWPGSFVGSYWQPVFFPIGRSDRMYVVRKYPSGVFCYQTTNGRKHLVYRANFWVDQTHAVRLRATKAASQGTSLLKYLMHSQPLQGSNIAMNDLAIGRDYVVYNHQDEVDGLYVSLLSKELRDGRGGSWEEVYNLAEDPVTKKSMINGKTVKNNGHDVFLIAGDEKEFYKKYGFPVTRTEIDLFAAKHKDCDF